MFAQFIPQKGNQLVTAGDDGFQLFEVGAGGAACKRVHSETSLGALSLVAIEESTSTLVACLANKGTHLASRVVVLYDMSTKERLTELHFEESILSIRVNMLRLVVIMERRIHMFEWSTLKPLPQISTVNCPNTRGLGALSYIRYFGETSYFAWPSTTMLYTDGGANGSNAASAISAGHESTSSRDLSSVGSSTISNGSSGGGGSGTSAKCEVRGDVVVMEILSGRLYMLTAHQTSAVTCIEFSPDGKRFATSSTKGTMIRIFSSEYGTLLHTLRRGTKDAIIDSLVFSSTGSLLAVTSNSSTLHVFRCDANNLAAPQQSSSNSDNEIRSFVKIAVREGTKYAIGMRGDEQLYLVAKSSGQGGMSSRNTTTSTSVTSAATLNVEVYAIPRGGGDGRKVNELKLEA